MRETEIVAAVFVALLAHSGCGPDVYRTGELPAEMIAAPSGKQTIVIVGDIMTWDRTQEHIERHGANYPFLATAPLLASADLTVGNLEGPVATAAKRRRGQFVYKVPPQTLSGLKWAGFDLVSLANNHLLDCGHSGLTETFRHLETAGVRPFGAGRDAAEANRPVIANLGQTKVAFLGLVAGETWLTGPTVTADSAAQKRQQNKMRERLEARADRPGTIVATRESVPRLVRQAQQQADFVVLVIHWGVRYGRLATDFQRTIARLAVAAGADLIVGHHAHIWQPVELVDGVPVIYGVGNFAFGSGNRRADEGLLVRAILDRGRLEMIELFPLYIKNRDSAVDYQTKVMRGAAAQDLIDRLNSRSHVHDTQIDFVGGRGVLRLPVRDKNP